MGKKGICEFESLSLFDLEGTDSPETRDNDHSWLGCAMYVFLWFVWNGDGDGDVRCT